MTMVQFMQFLQAMTRDHHKAVFSLREVAALAKESRPAAAMTLLRAQKKKLIGRVRNLWINLMTPPELLEIALAMGGASYLSFESALYRHGLLSQSPRGALTMATSGRSHLTETPLGNIRHIHLKPSLFFGFDGHRIAVPEKAWLDLVYIRSLQGRGDFIFGERFYVEKLRRKEIKKMATRYPNRVRKLALDPLG